jgi:hypothetical protein
MYCALEQKADHTAVMARLEQKADRVALEQVQDIRNAGSEAAAAVLVMREELSRKANSKVLNNCALWGSRICSMSDKQGRHLHKCTAMKTQTSHSDSSCE